MTLTSTSVSGKQTTVVQIAHAATCLAALHAHAGGDSQVQILLPFRTMR